MRGCSAGVAATDPAAPVDSGETVVVSGQKLPVENLIDRKVYSVTSDVQSAFGSVGDVLSVIPSPMSEKIAGMITASIAMIVTSIITTTGAE